MLSEKADDRTRTDNLLITNQLLCQLSHIGILNLNDSNGNRTRVTAVKGRCLNRLTMEPNLFFRIIFPKLLSNFGPMTYIRSNSPSRTRTYDNSVNSRALYRLSYRGITKGIFYTFKTSHKIYLLDIGNNFHLNNLPALTFVTWSSPRPISISQLHMLPCFHL